MKTNHTPTLHLSAAFLALCSETVLLDPAAKKAIATDGEAIALTPLPDGFTSARMVAITATGQPAAVTPDHGDPTDVAYDLSLLETPAAYRVAINPAKLAALAAAIGAESLVILEFPAHPAEGPVKVSGESPDSYGYLMPQPIPEGPEGLLIQSKINNRQSSIVNPAPLSPPIVTASAERHTLEIAFGGIPPKEIREALKDPALGFRYSGRGTKRGTPPSMWYGPDNPFTREKIQSLLGVEIAPAKAA